MVPSVAIKAGIRTSATSEPLQRPTTPPTATAAKKAGNTPAIFATETAIQAQSAWVAPTDKSKVPAMMAIVMPTAETPTNALCRRTLTKFPTLANPGVASPAISQTTTVTTAMPNRSHKRSQSSWFTILAVTESSGISDFSVCSVLKGFCVLGWVFGVVNRGFRRLTEPALQVNGYTDLILR